MQRYQRITEDKSEQTLHKIEQILSKAMHDLHSVIRKSPVIEQEGIETEIIGPISAVRTFARIAVEYPHDYQRIKKLSHAFTHQSKRVGDAFKPKSDIAKKMAELVDTNTLAIADQSDH